MEEARARSADYAQLRSKLGAIKVCPRTATDSVSGTSDRSSQPLSPLPGIPEETLNLLKVRKPQLGTSGTLQLVTSATRHECNFQNNGSICQSAVEARPYSTLAGDRKEYDTSPKPHHLKLNNARVSLTCSALRLHSRSLVATEPELHVTGTSISLEPAALAPLERAPIGVTEGAPWNDGPGPGIIMHQPAPGASHTHPSSAAKHQQGSSSGVERPELLPEGVHAVALNNPTSPLDSPLVARWAGKHVVAMTDKPLSSNTLQRAITHSRIQHGTAAACGTWSGPESADSGLAAGASEQPGELKPRNNCPLRLEDYEPCYVDGPWIGELDADKPPREASAGSHRPRIKVCRVPFTTVLNGSSNSSCITFYPACFWQTWHLTQHSIPQYQCGFFVCGIWKKVFGTSSADDGRVRQQFGLSLLIPRTTST
jgi:hypothetical protein